MPCIHSASQIPGRFIMLILTAALSFAGCNEPHSHVQITSPTGNRVPTTQSVIEVRFDRPMRQTSFDHSTLTVVGSLSGPHDGEFEFPSEKSVRFHVVGKFEESETVTVSLSKDIESRAGKKLRPYSFSFQIDDHAADSGNTENVATGRTLRPPGRPARATAWRHYAGHATLPPCA